MVPTNSVTKLWSVNSVLQAILECSGNYHEKTGMGTSGKKRRLHYRCLGTYLSARHVCLSICNMVYSRFTGQIFMKFRTEEFF